MDILRLPVHLRRALLQSSSFRTHLLRSNISTNNNNNNNINASSIDPSSLIQLSSSTLNSYIHTEPPNPAQLTYAASFFHSIPPQILFSAAHFRSLPPSPFPEVAFLGRSNVGKSSLLNALFGRPHVKIAYVSKRPGRTRTMNGFGVAGHKGGENGSSLPLVAAIDSKDSAAWRRFPRGGLIVTDMPGYGGGSREEWGAETLKVLERRKQLRKTFVLVDAQHGLKNSDLTLLLHLRAAGVAHQIILSKVDKLLWSGSKAPGPLRLSNGLLKLKELGQGIRERVDEEASDGRRAVGDILCCSSERNLDDHGFRRIGVDEIRWAVLSACGMESDSMGQRRILRMDDSNVPQLENQVAT